LFAAGDFSHYFSLFLSQYPKSYHNKKALSISSAWHNNNKTSVNGVKTAAGVLFYVVLYIHQILAIYEIFDDIRQPDGRDVSRVQLFQHFLGNLPAVCKVADRFVIVFVLVALLN